MSRMRIALTSLMALLLVGCPRPESLLIYNSTDEEISVINQKGVLLRVPPKNEKEIPYGGADLDRTKDGFKKIRIRYFKSEVCYLTPYLDLEDTSKPSGEIIESTVFLPSGELFVFDGKKHGNAASCFNSRCKDAMRIMVACDRVR